MLLTKKILMTRFSCLRATQKRLNAVFCLIFIVAAALPFSVQAQQALGTIEGRVQSSDGEEAGVWVIAETDDTPTHLTKIVVTDEQGRFSLPELPDAMYKVWVRGYGLADSDPLFLRTGAKDVSLNVFAARDPSLAAQVYPANYWYS